MGQEPSNRISGLRLGWPGWLALGLATFWLGFWAIVAPPPSAIEVALRPSLTVPLGKPKEVALTTSVAKLSQLFNRIGYDLEAVRKGDRAVPRLLLASVPRGLVDIVRPDERKAVFLRVMLPLVLEANEQVLRQRRFVLAAKARRAAGGRLTAAQNRELEAIAAEHRTSPDRIEDLLNRVDVVPPSIALSQAAIESGWGTSRFAVEGNAPFGQWTTEEFKGLVPGDRPEGTTYKVRTFDQLLDSVRSYIRNLNTHRAYKTFRKLRAEARAAGGEPDGLKLIHALASYAEQGQSYIELLGQVIAENDLQSLDGARLGDERPSLGPDA